MHTEPQLSRSGDYLEDILRNSGFEVVTEECSFGRVIVFANSEQLEALVDHQPISPDGRLRVSCWASSGYHNGSRSFKVLDSSCNPEKRAEYYVQAFETFKKNNLGLACTHYKHMSFWGRALR